MKVNRYILIAPALLACAACGDSAPKPAPKPEASALKTMPLDKAAEYPEVARNQKIVGRWRSDEGSIQDNRFLVLDVAGTLEYTLEKRGFENGDEAIYETSRGTVGWEDDILISSPEDSTPGWKAGFQSPKVMVIRTPEGEEIALSYKGL